jgi:CheY-like chemotaxis protein
MSPSALGSSVLVVDDDFVLLEIVTTVFGRAGLTVHSASSGEAALTLLREKGREFGWLMTDINLPGLVDGWSVAEAYRASYPDRPIIYLSAGACDERLASSGSLFVQKPLRIEEVARLAKMMQFATSKAA